MPQPQTAKNIVIPSTARNPPIEWSAETTTALHLHKGFFGLRPLNDKLSDLRNTLFAPLLKGAVSEADWGILHKAVSNSE